MLNANLHLTADDGDDDDDDVEAQTAPDLSIVRKVLAPSVFTGRLAATMHIRNYALRCHRLYIRFNPYRYSLMDGFEDSDEARLRHDESIIMINSNLVLDHLNRDDLEVSRNLAFSIFRHRGLTVAELASRGGLLVESHHPTFMTLADDNLKTINMDIYIDGHRQSAASIRSVDVQLEFMPTHLLRNTMKVLVHHVFRSKSDRSSASDLLTSRCAAANFGMVFRSPLIFNQKRIAVSKAVYPCQTINLPSYVSRNFSILRTSGERWTVAIHYGHYDSFDEVLHELGRQLHIHYGVELSVINGRLYILGPPDIASCQTSESLARFLGFPPMTNGDYYRVAEDDAGDEDENEVVLVRAASHEKIVEQKLVLSEHSAILDWVIKSRSRPDLCSDGFPTPASCGQGSDDYQRVHPIAGFNYFRLSMNARRSDRDVYRPSLVYLTSDSIEEQISNRSCLTRSLLALTVNHAHDERTEMADSKRFLREYMPYVLDHARLLDARYSRLDFSVVDALGHTVEFLFDGEEDTRRSIILECLIEDA